MTELGQRVGHDVADPRAVSVDDHSHAVVWIAELGRGVDVLAPPELRGVDPLFRAGGDLGEQGARAPGSRVQHEARARGIDILVNNVGAVYPRPDGVTSVTDADWERTVNLTLMAAVRTIRAAVPEMARRGEGSIVTISSVNASLPDPLVVDYSAAKAALTNFRKALSKDVGPSGIRVNTISPGPVATALWLGENGVAQSVSHAGGGSPEEVAAAAAAASVTGRFTQPQEVADLVLLLASDRFGNVTGADFRIDGGLVDTV